METRIRTSPLTLRESTNPLVPAVHDLTLFPSPFLHPPRFHLLAKFYASVPSSLQISSDTHPLYDLRASASFFQRWKKERDEYTRNTWAFVGTSPPFSRDATMLTPRVEYVFEQATNPLSPRPFDFERAVRFRRGKKEDLFLNFIPFSTYPTRLRPSPRRPRCSVERSP